MKFKLRNIISLLLVLCMFIQPLTPLMARQVEGTTTTSVSGSSSSGNSSSGNSSANLEKAKKDFEEKYNAVMKLKPIELGAAAKGVIGIANVVDNAKTLGKNLITSFKNGKNGTNEKLEKYDNYIK